MLVFLVVLFGVCSVCVADDGVSFHGRVIDESDKPLEFVTVKVVGSTAATMTRSDGRYELSCRQSDTIRIRFTYIGYRDVTRTFINPEGDLAVNVRMRPQERELNAVEIVDMKRQTSSAQLIGASSYRFAPDASGGSIENMLGTLAGVSSANELSSRYSVRGGSYDENSVYINGIELYRPLLISSGNQEGLSVINPAMVGVVGFSTGGFTAEYSDKMSSVLDITYRTPQSFEGYLGLSTMGASASIGQGWESFSQLHGVRYKRNSSLLGTTDTKGEYNPDFFDYQTYITLKLARRWKFSLLGNVSLNRYRFKPQDRVTSFGTHTDAKLFKVYFDGGENDRFETYFGAFSADYAASSSTALALTASAFMTNEMVAYDISGEYWLDQAGTGGDEAVGGELGVGRYHEHARNRLKSTVYSLAFKGVTHAGINAFKYGVTLNRETLFDRSREWELRDSAGYSVPVSPDGLNLQYVLSSNNDINSTRLSAYVQDDIRLRSDVGAWWLNGGIRVSRWSFNRETIFSPRFNVAFIPGALPAWTFRMAAGVYYQSPFYREFRQPVVDVDGNVVIRLNDDIKSQRSIHLIFGSDYTFKAFGRPFRLGGEAYYKNLSNIVPYEIDNLKLVYQGTNSASGYVGGVDFKLFGQFVEGSDSWISLSFMKSQETLNGADVPRPNDQRYNLGLYFTDYFPKIPRLKFSLRGIFSDGLPTVAARSSRDKGYFRMPPYKRVDVGFSYALIADADNSHKGAFKNIWLGFDIFNLLDISNVGSYYWVSDVNNIRYAVPNYLTRRQINVSLSLDF